MMKNNGFASTRWLLGIAGVVALAAVAIPTSNAGGVKQALNINATENAQNAASVLLKNTSVDTTNLTALDGYHKVDGQVFGDEPYLGFNIPAEDADTIIANINASGWEEWPVTGPNCAPEHLNQKDDGTLKNLCGYTIPGDGVSINIQPEDDHLRVDIAS